jgi:hypothetical protein
VKLPEPLFFSNSFLLYLTLKVKFFYKIEREYVVIFVPFLCLMEAFGSLSIDFSMIIWQYLAFTVNGSTLSR